jgi:K+-transporting ATPase ATPase B chain
MRTAAISPFSPQQLRAALPGACRRMHPRQLLRNPVLLVTALGAVLTTACLPTAGPRWSFVLQLAVWLWFTVGFGAFAAALAESRGKAQAAALRRQRATVFARRLQDGREMRVAASDLQRGDLVVCTAGDTIPADGEVVEGIASVDEAAVTGESAPVIRESGGDRSAVSGGTRVLSDRIVVRVTAGRGEGFLDRMIRLVEGAERQKTPNELALTALLATLTLVFLLVCATLPPFGWYAGAEFELPVLVALFVCLIPTTIGALVDAIGISGIDRMIQRNVLATSGRAVEAAGDVDVLLLDKTGTITFGNRVAVAFLPAPGVTEERLADAAQLASLADETPEGRSIAVLAKQRFQFRGREVANPQARFVPFQAATRMSGVDLGEGPEARQIRKGAAAAIEAFVTAHGGRVAPAVAEAVDAIARTGGTPLVVAENGQALGVVHLKDLVKGGIRQRFEALRAMGIRTVMVTGDNPRTAAAIAAEAGVDGFLAEATPEMKLARIRAEQAAGHLVAMTGDGTNDAPALAQADVGVAMNTGTQAAREAGNMVDLDSNPTKLLDVVEIGRQLILTRGALTTFSLANDVAKYFAILPALCAGLDTAAGPLAAFDVMRLHSPTSAILAAVVFNALVVVALIPLALHGVRNRPMGADALLRRNLLVFGLGGLAAPFLGIKLLDEVLWLLGATA